MDRPTLEQALARWRGKVILLYQKADGAVRLQWPETHGAAVGTPGAFEVVDARIAGDIVTVKLKGAEGSLTLQFELSAIVNS